MFPVSVSFFCVPLSFSVAVTVVQATEMPAVVSQVFRDQVLLELNGASAKAPKEEFYLAASPQFTEKPNFKLLDRQWTQSFQNSTWVHFGFSEKEKGPKEFHSAFLMSMGSDLGNFQSSLPVMVVDTLGVPGHLKREYQECFWGILEPTDFPQFPGRYTHSGRGGIKRRGSSSRSQPKFPLSLEFRDHRGKDQKCAVLNFPAASDWVLSPPSKQDPSLLRNPFVYALSRDCGQYAPRTQFVEVFLNTGNRRLEYRKDYFGVYSFVEKISGENGRVELGKPDKASSPHGLSRGLLFKYDRPGPGERGLEVKDLEATFYLVSPKESELLHRDALILQQILKDFALAVRSDNGSSPVSGKSFLKIIDEGSWHTWRWLGELTGNIDLYRASCFFHLPVSGPKAGLIKLGPVWDFDRSINSRDARDDDPEGWVAGKKMAPAKEEKLSIWWTELLARPDFRKAHLRHWQRLRRDALSWKNIEMRLTQYQSQLETVSAGGDRRRALPKTPFLRDRQRWRGEGPRGGSLQGEVSMMSAWLQKRLHWIDQQVEAELALDQAERAIEQSPLGDQLPIINKTQKSLATRRSHFIEIRVD